MNTQTFAQAQNITPINDDALIAVNGGGAGAENLFSLDIPLLIGGGIPLTGGKITKAAADY